MGNSEKREFASDNDVPAGTPSAPAIEVKGASVTSTHIDSRVTYDTSVVEVAPNGTYYVTPKKVTYDFRTERAIPKVGLMIVGLGGNNGSTVMASVIANREKISWDTRTGTHTANYFGSVTQATTIPIGYDTTGTPVYIPVNKIVPMVDPNTIVIGGWDISGAPMDQAMRRAQVLEFNLQEKVAKEMAAITPLPSIYYPDFIAANQKDRADNVVEGTAPCGEHLETLRNDIRSFKKENGLDKVIVMWSANTERYCEPKDGVHDTEENWLKGLAAGDAEIAPSQVFAAAAILEGCSYINGSPQNTFVPAIRAMAAARGVFIAGDDFKSGQTKFKSSFVEFLVRSGIKPRSIVSYNHLGNNDGKNLSSHKQFRSKEISKSSVVDDMVAAGRGVLYDKDEKPDHCVVIKYVPHVGDSKRAMDEYVSDIFMGGKSEYAIHNVCEDSLLAAPLIVDLVVLTELFERVSYSTDGEKYSRFESILSVLSLLLKAPIVPENAPVVNAFAEQRACLDNLLRALVGLPPLNHMGLEFKTRCPLGKQ